MSIAGMRVTILQAQLILTGSRAMQRNVKCSLLDWGACHRLIDHLQLGTDSAQLLPRVRLLVDCWLAHCGGWPVGAPPPEDRFLPLAPDLNDRKKKRKRARKRCK